MNRRAQSSRTTCAAPLRRIPEPDADTEGINGKTEPWLPRPTEREKWRASFPSRPGDWGCQQPIISV